MNRAIVVFVAACVLLSGLVPSGSVRAGGYDDVQAGDWDASATWGVTEGLWPATAGDTALIDTAQVTVPSGLNIPAVVTTVGGDGELYFGSGGTHDMSLVLNDGGYVNNDRSAATAINGTVTVNAGTARVHAGLDHSLTWNGAIASGTTAVHAIHKVGASIYGGGLVLKADSPGYSGQWEIGEGHVYVYTPGGLGSGAVTVGGWGETPNQEGNQDAILDLNDMDTTGVTGPAAIHLRYDDYGTYVRPGTITFWRGANSTATIDWSNDPVTTLERAKISAYRTTVNWYDPVHVVDSVLLTHATGGNFNFYGPVSSESTTKGECVLEIDGHNGSYVALHAANPDLVGKVYVNRGIFQTFHADALVALDTVEVDNDANFDPRVSPDPGDPYPHVIIRDGGTFGNRSFGGTLTMDVELAGGHMAWGDLAVDFQGDVEVSADSSAQTIYQLVTFSGVISGAGRFTLQPVWKDIALTNPGNTITGGLHVEGQPTAGGGVHLHAPGAEGDGPLSGDADARLFLENQSGAADWTITNDVSGAMLVKVEDGSGDYKLTVRGGTVSPDWSSTPLSIDGDLAFAESAKGKATLDAEIQAPPVAVRNRKLAVYHDVSDLANGTLDVTLTDLTLTDLADFYGGPPSTWAAHEVLTCANDLPTAGERFGTVSFPQGVGGPVSYTYSEKAGTSVTVQLTIPGDADLSGAVDYMDLGILATNYDLSGGWAEGDFAHDGKVDYMDLGVLATNYDLTIGSVKGAAAVPAPAVLALLAVGAVGLLRRRR